MTAGHLQAYRMIQHALDDAFRMLNQPMAADQEGVLFLEQLVETYLAADDDHTTSDPLSAFLLWVQAQK